MNKKTQKILTSLASCVLAATTVVSVPRAISSCSSNKELKDFEINVQGEKDSLTYTDAKKQQEICTFTTTGLPSGVVASYDCEGTDAKYFRITGDTLYWIGTNEEEPKPGEYNITIIATCEGYNDQTIPLTLTIDPKEEFNIVIAEDPVSALTYLEAQSSQDIAILGTDIQDNSAEVIYSISGTDKEFFSLDPSSNIISWKGQTTPNPKTYNITITATCDGYNDQTKELSLNVAEEGQFAFGVTQSKDELSYIDAAKDETEIATLTAHDDEGALSGVTYNIKSGEDNEDKFKVEGNKLFWIGGAIPGDYEITLTADCDGYKQQEKTISLTIEYTFETASKEEVSYVDAKNGIVVATFDTIGLPNGATTTYLSDDDYEDEDIFTVNGNQLVLTVDNEKGGTYGTTITSSCEDYNCSTSVYISVTVKPIEQIELSYDEIGSSEMTISAEDSKDSSNIVAQVESNVEGVTYSLTGDDHEQFKIKEKTGEITYVGGAIEYKLDDAHDVPQDKIYDLQVVATKDGEALEGTIDFNPTVEALQPTVMVANGITYYIPYTEANAEMLLNATTSNPADSKKTAFTNDQGHEINIDNAEITQFVLGKDFADAYGDTLPNYFMKDFFAYSTQTTIDCDISVLDDGITNPGNYCFRGMFYNCTELTTLSDGFNLPQNLTTVGIDFAASMFYNCTELTTLPDGFNLPQNLEFVANSFAAYMFNGCTSLTTLPDGFNLPQNLSYSAGTYFAQRMFNNCTSLTTLPDGFNLPQNLTTSIGSSFADGMFYGCKSLTTLPDGFNLPQNATNIGNSFASRMFYGCTSLTTLPKGFNLPQNFTYTGSNFALYMFYNCTSLRSPSNYVTSIKIPEDISENSNFCYQMFYGITGNITSDPADAVDGSGTPNPGSTITFRE